MRNICRTCMSKDDEMISIFDREKSPSINDMIMTISSLEFIPNDTLPSGICVTCVETLEITYYFKEQVIRCNNALQKQSKRAKLLGRCKMLALQQLNEEDAETGDEEEYFANEQNVPIVASGHALSNVASNIDDHSSNCHDPLLSMDNNDPSSECVVNSLHLELPFNSEARGDVLPIHSSTDDIRGINSPLEEICTKFEEVEVEEHGVQFEGNCRITPKPITPKNEADDNGFSSEDDLPLTELHISNEIYPSSQDVQQNSDENGEETMQASERMKKLGNMEYLFSDKPLQSDNCEKTVDTLNNLERLTKMPTGESFFKCQHCNVSFEHYKDVIRHICSKTAQVKMVTPVTCEICGKTFAAVHYLKMHMKSHVGKPNESQHSNAANLKMHVKSPTIKRNESQYGNTANMDSGSQQNPISSHAGGAAKPSFHQCELCGIILRNATILRVHMRVHTGERPYKCRHCNAAFSQGCTMKLHIKRKHRDVLDSLPNRCEFCEERFEATSDLEIHMKVHAGKPLFKCQKCNKSFRHDGLLNRHIRLRICNPVDPKPIKCEVCGKSFTSRSFLKKHMRSHTGERPYECQQCDAKYMIMSNLTVHIRRKHTTEGQPRPYQCEICGKAYESPSDLKLHMRYHTGERPFKCQHCNAGFVRRAELNKHIRWYHSKGTPKPHKCEACEKAFRTPYGLSKHMNNHSAERPFKCIHCNAAFKNSSNLKRHILTHAGKDSTNGPT